MAGERIVFTEESNPQQYLKVIASGEVDETMLDALVDYVKRQKKRLGLPPIPSHILTCEKPAKTLMTEDDE